MLQKKVLCEVLVEVPMRCTFRVPCKVHSEVVRTCAFNVLQKVHSMHIVMQVCAVLWNERYKVL